LSRRKIGKNRAKGREETREASEEKGTRQGLPHRK
jgi:hypothetical protein